MLMCYCVVVYNCGVSCGVCAKLFRQVAAALPGVDRSTRMQEDGILFVHFIALLGLLRVGRVKCYMLTKASFSVAYQNLTGRVWKVFMLLH